jgi:hypothetical protein
MALFFAPNDMDWHSHFAMSVQGGYGDINGRPLTMFDINASDFQCVTPSSC